MQTDIQDRTDSNRWLKVFYKTDTFGNLLGAKAISVSRTECVYEYEVQNVHLNPNGILHGGILFSVMDSCQGGFIHFFLDPIYKYAATGTATIRYLKPIQSGSVRIRSTLKEQKRRRLVIVSHVYDEEGAEIAVLEEIWIAIPKERTDDSV
ncbi:PaaI family thioesterase [Leptospira sp. WS92.C1]